MQCFWTLQQNKKNRSVCMEDICIYSWRKWLHLMVCWFWLIVEIFHPKIKKCGKLIDIFFQFRYYILPKRGNLHIILLYLTVYVDNTNRKAQLIKLNDKAYNALQSVFLNNLFTQCSQRQIEKIFLETDLVSNFLISKIISQLFQLWCMTQLGKDPNEVHVSFEWLSM